MADIELVIKISEKVKQAFDNAESNELKGGYYDNRGIIGNAIKNAIPLPKGHGRLIDISKLDNDRIESDNPIMYLTINREYIEAVSLDYLNNLPTIIEADKESAEWVDDKCSVCGKGIEDLIESSDWYWNENPKYCPFCGIKIQPYKGRK